jgi:hypothetical protein
MAVPTIPAAISLNDINIELGEGSGTVNMNMNTQASQHLPSALSAPHSVSEWSGYTHSSAPPAPVKCNLVEGPIFFTGSWFHPDTTETGFRCEFKINSGSWQYWGIAAAGATNFTGQIVGCSSGNSIYFRVRAYNGAGNSAWCEDTTPVTATGSGCI